MKIITYIKLYRYLRDNDGLKPWEAVECISEVREMAPEILVALKEWAEGDPAPDITIHGVTFSKLVNDEGMRPIRAFLMLDWIYREPEEAMSYLASGRLRAPILELAQEDKDRMAEIVSNLKKKNPDLKVPEVKETEEECSKGEDVTLPTEEHPEIGG